MADPELTFHVESKGPGAVYKAWLGTVYIGQVQRVPQGRGAVWDAYTPNGDEHVGRASKRGAAAALLAERHTESLLPVEGGGPTEVAEATRQLRERQAELLGGEGTFKCDHCERTLGTEHLLDFGVMYPGLGMVKAYHGCLDCLINLPTSAQENAREAHAQGERATRMREALRLTAEDLTRYFRGMRETERQGPLRRRLAALTRISRGETT